MKTTELTGAQLDYWVAKAEGLKPTLAPHMNIQYNGKELFGNVCRVPGKSEVFMERYQPSMDPAQGSPIIERENIGLLSPKQSPCGEWHASYVHPDFTNYTGPTLLVAGMRCYVAAKFGDEVHDEV